MGASNEASRTRTFGKDDPWAHARLEYAWENLQHVLEDGRTASQLDSEDLDHIIGDLVGIRHHRLTGVGAGDTLRTIIDESDERMTLASYATDELGNELGPLSVEDQGGRGS